MRDERNWPSRDRAGRAGPVDENPLVIYLTVVR